MNSKLIRLEDGMFVEIEVPAGQAQPLAGGAAEIVNTKLLDKIQPILLNICRPITEVWKQLNQQMRIEQAEVELGLSFEGEGNLFITKSKAGANLTVKLVLKP